MSDINIPGVTNKFNSQEAINKIMETKREKLKSMETEKQEIIEKKKILNEIKQKALNLQNITRKMYGIDSPFEEKISKSSNERAFIANAAKNADLGEYKIKIQQKATSHKIASSSLSRNFRVPAGVYNIQVGNDTVKIDFNGGKIEDLVRDIRAKAKGVLTATLAYDTDKTQVMILEAEKTGENNRITFLDEKSKNLFKEMGFFIEVPAFEKKIELTNSNITALKPAYSPFINNGILTVDRMQEYRINLPEKIAYREGLSLEVTINLEKIPETEKLELPTGPNFTKKGELNLYGIQVEGETPIAKIPEMKKEEKQSVVEDDHYIDIITDKRKISLNELEIKEGENRFKFKLNELLSPDETLVAVVFKNNNSFKRTKISDLVIYDEKSKSGVKFTNELSTAQNAIVDFDGIRVTRPSNTIDDLIKGVTIQIYEKTDREENLKIDRDYEKIVKSIADMLQNFNELIEMINKETFASPNSEERGKFSSDYSLISLSSKLRTLIMNPYQTKYGNELTLLSQIGISTDVSGTFQMNKEKLKGLLEIDENLFIEKMNKYADGVKELFGRDSNGDLIVDSGLGYEMYNMLRAYTINGQGFFDVRSRGLDEQVSNKDKDIRDYKAQLEKEEKDLKNKFFKMEKAMQDLEQNTKKIDNFNKQNR